MKMIEFIKRSEQGTLNIGDEVTEPWYLGRNPRPRFYKVVLIEPLIVIESADEDKIQFELVGKPNLADHWKPIDFDRWLELLAKSGVSPVDILMQKIGYELP